MWCLYGNLAMWEYDRDRRYADALLNTIDAFTHKKNLEPKDINILNKYKGRLKYYLSQYKYRYENKLISYKFSDRVNVCMQDIVMYLKDELGIY